MLTETFDEVRRAIESYLMGYLRYIQATQAEQVHCPFQTDLIDELANGEIGDLLDLTQQIGPAHVHGIRQFGNSKIFLSEMQINLRNQLIQKFLILR